MRIRILLLILFALVLGTCVMLGLRTPSNDRSWAVDFSKLVTVDTRPDGTLRFHTVRDFTYAGVGSSTPGWIDMAINPDEVTGAWFVLDLFSPIKQIGHTFIVFDLKDGRSIAFSIEARREAAEKYNFIGGFMRRYELQYLWATERDLIPERVVYLEEPIQMYRLTIPAAAARALLVSFAEETNALALKPRFYNTFTANCTNLLAKITNKYYPGTLPYDISWNLTGLSVDYLKREGYIDARDTQANADLTPYRDAMIENATTTYGFTAFLRTKTRIASTTEE